MTGNTKIPQGAIEDTVNAIIPPEQRGRTGGHRRYVLCSLW